MGVHYIILLLYVLDDPYFKVFLIGSLESWVKSTLKADVSF